MCSDCATGLNEWEKDVMAYMKKHMRTYGRISPSVLVRKFHIDFEQAKKLVEKYDDLFGLYNGVNVKFLEAL